MGVEAKVICDSISQVGDRLTTFEIKYHRFIMAELNTHRAFSRNSASSRAIPADKVREGIIKDPAVPVMWPAEGRGMYVSEEIPKHMQDTAAKLWHIARINATNVAGRMAEIGVHKSIVNRILEPFQYVTSIISTTEPGLQNFFDQRDAEQAQPEMQFLAIAMKMAYANSKPTVVHANEWHMPYIDERDRQQFDNDPKYLRPVSAARCARVSYMNHQGMRSWADDNRLYDRLTTANPPHWSPLEHVATPYVVKRGKPRPAGNFVGWEQLRHIVEAGKE